MAQRMNEIKCNVVGDVGVGKTCLLIRYADHPFPDVYTPEVFEQFVPTVMVDGKPITALLWDSMGKFVMNIN